MCYAGVCSFDKTFHNVGGINAPKRIQCLGTDGRYRPQLVKGKDDLRQDAVMQQVFNIMNDLLASSKHTSKLMIRTYKVIIHLFDGIFGKYRYIG